MIISIPTHLLECLKCETLASNDQDLEQQAFLFIASEDVNCYNFFGRQFGNMSQN